MKSLEQMAKEVNSGKLPTLDKEPENFENAFFVLEHPNYKRVFVNPSKFSFLAFFWSIIFYAYYKRWLGLVLIIASFWVSEQSVEQAFRHYHWNEKIYEEFIWFGGIVCLITQLVAGFKGNRGKLLTLLSKGYRIVDRIKADNVDAVKAILAEKQKEKQLQASKEARVELKPSETTISEQTAVSHEIKEKQFDFPTEQQQEAQKNASVSSPKQTSGIADEIESFANLRDKGIITEDEFQKKKKELLNLQ